MYIFAYNIKYIFYLENSVLINVKSWNITLNWRWNICEMWNEISSWFRLAVSLAFIPDSGIILQTGFRFSGLIVSTPNVYISG